MTPTTFTEDQADYLHSKCWAEDTYYIVQDNDVDGPDCDTNPDKYETPPATPTAKNKTLRCI